MKQFLNQLFFLATGVSLGIGIATQINLGNQPLSVMVAYIVASVCFVLAIVMTALIGREKKLRKNLNVTLQKHDLVLQVGKTYTINKRGKLHAGEYTILATDENQKTFNVRLNDYVKEFKHNTKLILAEGDEISPRSSNIILR